MGIHQKKIFKIYGMTCVSCERRIENQLKEIQGLSEVKVSYSKGTAECIYNMAFISEEDIVKQIEEAGYSISPPIEKDEIKNKLDNVKMFVVLIGIFSVYKIMKYFGLTNIFYIFPQAEESMEYGMLFIIGLFTSIHCIAMCGGINLSQCMSHMNSVDGDKLSTLSPSFLYNLGRVISYTLVGTLVGGIGSVVSFSGESQGIVQIIAGIFMMIMGLNMLNVFPWLRHFNPRMPKIFSKKATAIKKSNSPFYVGLINGLMPCGPLQAMQLYALSTGSPIKGGFAMFLFSLGTVPLMFAMGALSSVLSKKFTNRVMSIGALLVVILGVSMFNSGMSLSGVAVPGIRSSQGSSRAQIKEGIQIVNTTLEPGKYPSITIKVGIPVKWTITAEKGSINGCNNRIFIPQYGIEKKFDLGENIIEFTPTEEGTFTYSCWMGMIRSNIIVIK